MAQQTIIRRGWLHGPELVFDGLRLLKNGLTAALAALAPARRSEPHRWHRGGDSGDDARDDTDERFRTLPRRVHEMHHARSLSGDGLWV